MDGGNIDVLGDGRRLACGVKCGPAVGWCVGLTRSAINAEMRTEYEIGSLILGWSG